MKWLNNVKWLNASTAPTIGILRIAYKLLVNDRSKFMALLVGIIFAVFLMVQMTSMFSGITAPVFEGGTLWYKRKAAVANYQETGSLYQQAVLSAFAQVADTLCAVQHDAEILQAQDEALAAAQQALHLVQANFQAGLANYSNVLIADVQYHQAKIADLQTIAARYQDTVALFVALGGGWWNGK